MTILELGLVVWIVLIGLVGAGGFWSRGSGGLALISPSIGAAMYGLSALAMFSVGTFSTLGSLIVASVVAIAMAGYGHWRGSMTSPGTLMRGGGYALAGTLAVFTVTVVGSFTRLTPDSMDYLTISGGLERFGAMPDLSPDVILKRQFMTPILQTGGVVTGRGYMVSLIPLLVTSGLGFMIWLGGEVLRRWGVRLPRVVAIAALVGVFLLSTNRVVYNIFYINSHGIFATFLVVLIGLVWLAATTGVWQTVILAGLVASAIVPLRAEGVIVVALFLLPVLVSVSVPQRTKWLIVAPIAATTLVWNGYALRQILPADEFGLTSTPTVSIVLALGLVAIVALGYVDRAERFLVFVPALSLGLLVAYTGIRVIRWQSLTLDTMEAVGTNIGSAGLWSSFWWIAPIAVVVGFATTRIKHEGFLLWGLASYPVALLAFAYLRGGAYRVGAGDSANRMLMHVVFVIGLYLILAMGQLAKSMESD